MNDCFLLNDIKSLKVSDVLKILDESFQKRLYSFKNIKQSISIKSLYSFNNLNNFKLRDVTNGTAFMSNIMRLEFFWKPQIIDNIHTIIKNSGNDIQLEDILIKNVIVKVSFLLLIHILHLIDS